LGGGRANVIESEAGADTIGGGAGNLIQSQADGATIAGGTGNVIAASADSSSIGGGLSNLIDATVRTSVIAGGSGNVVGYGAFGVSIGGGVTNTIPNSAFSTIGGGSGNMAGGHIGSTIGGGYKNRIQNLAAFATIPGGYSAQAINYGQQAYAGGCFAAAGDAQSSLYVLRGVTTNATPQELYLDEYSQRLKVPTGGAWTFDILVVATLADELAVNGYQIRGVIKHTTAGVTSLVGAPVQTVLAAEAPAWVVTVEADDANDVLMIKVTGTTAKTIRWVATVRTVEVVF
jgi:hypothetical protein